MKVLLLNAPWHSVDTQLGVGKLGCRAGSRWPHMRDYHGKMVSRYQPFPFFLATATAMLKEAGFDAIIHDSIVLGESYEEFYEFVQLTDPDLILSEISSPSIYNDLEIARKIKRLLPDVKIAVAGLHAPIAQESFLYEHKSIDFAIYGEYEHPLVLLAQAMNGDHNYSAVPNLVFRGENKICKTHREQLLPMDVFPWPERDDLPPLYYDGCGGMYGLELQIHSSRGCPFHCNFCVLPQVIYAGHTYRMRSPYDVVDEIEANFQKHHYTHFYIDDDTININKEHFLLLCRLIKERGLDRYPWACMGRADLMDDEMLYAMKQAGCYAIKYGMESFNPAVLELSGKSLNIERNIEFIKKTENLGIKVHLTYCLGMLGDTRTSVEDTITRSLELRADSRQYSIATPFVGSRLWEEYKQRGFDVSTDFSKFDAAHQAVVSQNDLSAEELTSLKEWAERLNKYQLLRTLTSQYRTEDFSNRILHAIRLKRNILICGDVRLPVLLKIADLSYKNGSDADVLFAEQPLDGFGDISKYKLCAYPPNVSFGDADMFACVADNDYDAAILALKEFTTDGFEKTIEKARTVTPYVLIVLGHAKVIPLWE